MARTEFEKIAGPSVLVCWCDLVDRKPHDWRANTENRRHSITFEPGAPFPDGETAPCPVNGCSGHVRLKPAPTPKPKKTRKRRKKSGDGEATGPDAPNSA